MKVKTGVAECHFADVAAIGVQTAQRRSAIRTCFSSFACAGVAGRSLEYNSAPGKVSHNKWWAGLNVIKTSKNAVFTYE